MWFAEMMPSCLGVLHTANDQHAGIHSPFRARGRTNSASVPGGPELLKLSPPLSPGKDLGHRQLFYHSYFRLLKTGQQSPYGCEARLCILLRNS